MRCTCEAGVKRIENSGLTWIIERSKLGGCAMQCWFCEKEAKGTCKACGRGLCRDHAHIHDAFTQTKTDTSTGYTSYYQVYGALKCTECKLDWTYQKPH